MQKDLEKMVTDGMIDVEFDGDEISMSKEYEHHKKEKRKTQKAVEIV